MCCYINIASPASYLSVNIHVAKMFGLNVAVYWSVVSEILDRVKDFLRSIVNMLLLKRH